MTEDLLFRLLRAAIWNTPVSFPDGYPAGEEWAHVFAMAKAHALHGILFDVIEKLPSDAGVPRRLAAEWMVATCEIERQNAKLKSVELCLRAMWNEHGIDAVLLKGSTIAEMYPVPEHRVCGDIDWWIPDSQWDKAAGLIARKGCEIHYDSDGDSHYMFDGVVIEHHRNGLYADGYEGVLIMLVGHVIHHAAVFGIGMRHLCDIAVAYRYCYGKYDADRYLDGLKKNGLLGFSRLLGAALALTLAMDLSLLPQMTDNVKISSNDVSRFVSMVLLDGDLGKENRRTPCGVLSRGRLFLRYAPMFFIKRWGRLMFGRLSRKRYFCDFGKKK